MKVMVLVKGSGDCATGKAPNPEHLAAMMRYNRDLLNAGVLLACEGLGPISQAVRISGSDNERIVVDGPFTETKELLGGFWLWQVESMAEAIEWAKRCPNPMQKELEIRAVLEPEQFPLAYGPTVNEKRKQPLAAV